MIDPLVTIAVDVKNSPKGASVPISLRSLIYQGSEFPADRHATGFCLDKILLHFNPDRFKQIAETADDRVQPANGVTGLKVIDGAHNQQGQHQDKQPVSRTPNHPQTQYQNGNKYGQDCKNLADGHH